MVYDLEIELRIGRVPDSSVAVEISTTYRGEGGRDSCEKANPIVPAKSRILCGERTEVAS
jgi:hypothetical protein